MNYKYIPKYMLKICKSYKQRSGEFRNICAEEVCKFSVENSMLLEHDSCVCSRMDGGYNDVVPIDVNKALDQVHREYYDGTLKGLKIQTIKVVREITTGGLKASKHIVDCWDWDKEAYKRKINMGNFEL